MTRPQPFPRDWNRFSWTSGEDGQLQFQHCRACDRLMHPPTPVCRHCGSGELDVRGVSSRGVVQSHTTTQSRWHTDDPHPYVVAVVAIDEDPAVRLTTNVVGCPPDEVAVGLGQLSHGRTHATTGSMRRPRSSSCTSTT